jgi:hypothetical protein
MAYLIAILAETNRASIACLGNMGRPEIPTVEQFHPAGGIGGCDGQI